jgi:hypothetical protein
MPKNILTVVGITILIICVCLSGCFESDSQSDEEQRFVGTWNMEEMETTVTFYSNGVIGGFFGDEYEIKDDKLIILSRFAGTIKQESYDYSFSNNDTRLILININTEVKHTLIKQ